jgi:glycosyltransferase involved in cell wall biosynthesis
MLKVLFQNRPDTFLRPGGDTIQMEHTRAALLRRELAVDVSLEPAPDISGYDIIHVFNIQTSIYSVRQCANAVSAGLPLVVSPIFWDPRPAQCDPHIIRYGAHWPGRIMASAFPRLAGLLAPHMSVFRARHGTAAARKMLRLADALLPNSYAELESIVNFFNVPSIRCKASVVRNGIEKSATERNHHSAIRPAGIPAEPYVLQVGRVEPVKNQLRLIQALTNRPEIPLVLVGQPTCARYLDACRRAANIRGNTWFVEHRPHDELPAIYRSAKVHVLPSFRESPGLATMEAAVWGANCVVSCHGPIGEYFGSDVWCCDPGDPDSIRCAVLSAWDALPRSDLGARMKSEFTWDHAAAETLAAYRRLRPNSFCDDEEAHKTYSTLVKDWHS